MTSVPGQQMVRRPSSRSGRPGVGRRRRLSVGRVAIVVALTALAVLVLLPLIYALAASFKPLDELMSQGDRLLPSTWRPENYREAWEQAQFALGIRNSVIITGSAVVAGVLAASMCGYVLARRLLWGQRFWESALVAAIFLGAGTPTLYPRFVIAQKLNLLNLAGITIVELAEIVLLTTFLVYGFCVSMGTEVEDAARLDGCGLFRTYFYIALPMMRPILTTITVLTFQWSWNAFQTPLAFTLPRPELRTITVSVFALKTTSGEAVGNYPVLMAGAMLALIPIVLVYIIAHRYFMDGLTEGATKG